MPLRVRKAAPNFRGQAVVDGSIKEITLQDYAGHYLVLLFYPMDFTYVSPTEILAFSDQAKEFYHYNCSIVGLSTDSEFTHLAWMKIPREEGGLGGIINIALLSDKSMKISRDYGVLDRDTGISHRGLFIIDPQSILRHVTMNDLEVGRSVDETLRLVRAFQFTDRHLKVCPVDWKPGDPGLGPDPIQTGRYFEGYFEESRGKSNTQIKDDHTVSVEEKRIARVSVNEDGVAGRGNISEFENSTLSHRKRPIDSNNETDYRKGFNVKSMNESLTASINYENTKENDLKRKENRSYKLYSTTLPNNEILKIQKEKLFTSNVGTTSSTQPKVEEISFQDSSNTNYKYQNEQQNPKEYLRNAHLKPPVNNYYNEHKSSKQIQDETVRLPKDISPTKSGMYELKKDETSKYNERIAQEENERLRTKQDNQERKESTRLNKFGRKFKPDADANVKDVNYHTGNARLIQANKNKVPIVDKRDSLQKDQQQSRTRNHIDVPKIHINTKEDSFDEVGKYLESQYKRQQDNVRDFIAKQNSNREQVGVISPSSREDFQHGKFNRKRHTNQEQYAGSLNEPLIPNQRQMFSKNLQSASQVKLEVGRVGTTPTGKVLKSNLKKDKKNIREETTQRLDIQGRNIKPQLTADDYNKAISEASRNKNWREKALAVKQIKHELNFGLNDHLIM